MISEYIMRLVCLKKYFQTVSFDNCVKRYVYDFLGMNFNEKYEYVVEVDKCTATIRMSY
jgi:hypothetical protein